MNRSPSASSCTVASWPWLTLPAMLVAGCLLYENPVPKNSKCATPGTVEDGDPCRCDQDCKSDASGGFCLQEDPPDGWQPHGTCFGECSLDADCGDGAGCHKGRCLRRCEATADCAIGRACWEVREIKLCFPFCDEHADCESGNCNLYSGECLPAGASPKGLAYNAECREDGECRSNWCSKGRCLSPCDPEFQRCPEGASCNAKGVCIAACTDKPECSVCDEEDAGVACE